MERKPPTGGRDRLDDSHSSFQGSGASRRTFLRTAGAALGGLTTVGLAGCLVRGEESDLEGEIRIDGSNTLLPHGAAVAEEFQWRNNRVRIPVRGSGTGAGFQRFCADETDVQNASRPVLTPDDVPPEELSEQEQCSRAGVDYVEIEAAIDGIAVWVHPENHWCDCLTVDELERIWEPNSNVQAWGDVREEWAGTPFDTEIDLYGRDPASGTFDSFTEAITGEIGRIRADYSASADTNVVVRGVRGSQSGIGWGGYGYYEENKDDLKLVDIDNGDGCVTANRASIESGDYQPLTRTMYVYFNLSAFEQAHVREFARFYLEPIDEDADREPVEPGEELAWTQWAARKVGYFATTPASVAESRDRLEEVLVQYE